MRIVDLCGEFVGRGQAACRCVASGGRSGVDVAWPACWEWALRPARISSGRWWPGGGRTVSWPVWRVTRPGARISPCRRVAVQAVLAGVVSPAGWTGAPLGPQEARAYGLGGLGARIPLHRAGREWHGGNDLSLGVAVGDSAEKLVVQRGFDRDHGHDVGGDGELIPPIPRQNARACPVSRG